MARILWDKDYEDELHFKNSRRCPHCISDGFDSDSALLTIENYIDLYFERVNENIVSLRGTNKNWCYEVRHQFGYSKTYEILLKDDMSTQLVLRGDTIGTYKWPLALLKGKTIGRNGDLSYENLSRIHGLDLEQLNFCECEKHNVYNNHTIGSFMLIPKPYSGSLNTGRARAPYYDNIFMFLNMVKDFCINGHVSDIKMNELFKSTEAFWALFKGNEGYINYIKAMALEPFCDNIPELLNNSPSSWNTETVNLYISTLNKCVEERNKLLFSRVKETAGAVS